jgi:hypothetical protein
MFSKKLIYWNVLSTRKVARNVKKFQIYICPLMKLKSSEIRELVFLEDDNKPHYPFLSDFELFFKKTTFIIKFV